MCHWAQNEAPAMEVPWPEPYREKEWGELKSRSTNMELLIWGIWVILFERMVYDLLPGVLQTHYYYYSFRHYRRKLRAVILAKGHCNNSMSIIVSNVGENIYFILRFSPHFPLFYFFFFFRWVIKRINNAVPLRELELRRKRYGERHQRCPALNYMCNQSKLMARCQVRVTSWPGCLKARDVQPASAFCHSAKLSVCVSHVCSVSLLLSFVKER